MPCYHPIPATRGQGGRMRLHPPAGDATHWLPCGRCLGCREATQQLLAIRLIHEAQSASNNIFLTLTYDDDKVPDGLQKAELQRFWKRLRKHTGERLKYLACGEYGDRTQRPHYHAATLNLTNVHDWKTWNSENQRSETIERIWGNGIVTGSPLTADRARYVAGYVLKKAGWRKQIYCDEDGVELEPPFRVMSKGLGTTWLQKYAEDLKHGYLQHDGAKYSIPRYYADKIKQQNEQLHNRITQQKEDNHEKREKPDNQRLKDAEKIREQQIKAQRSRKII